MRAIAVIPLPAAIGAMALLLSAGFLGGSPREQTHSNPCRSLLGETVACADSGSRSATAKRPLPAGDAPAFLFAASVRRRADRAHGSLSPLPERDSILGPRLLPIRYRPSRQPP